MYTPQDKDPHLWRLAQARASFKSHLTVYLLVVAGLWILWFVTGSRTYNHSFPWPLWPTFGWGIGLVFHYIGAYVNTRGRNSVEAEYEKLVRKGQ